MLVGMSDAELAAESSAPLSWGLGSFLFEKAFAELSSGLKWMFWGLLLQLVGGGLLAVGLLPVGLLLAQQAVPAQALFVFLPVAFLALGVGGLVVLWGEQKCLHLKLPLGMTPSLPGHRWLRAAYFCHLGGLLMRIGRRLLPRNIQKWTAIVALPVQVLGFVFLLLFLRKLADVLVRHDLKRLIDAIFGLVVAALVCGVIVVTGKQWDQALPRQIGLPLVQTCFAVSLLSFLGAIGSHLILLRCMSAAVRSFAQFLATHPELEAVETEPSFRGKLPVTS